MKEWDSAGKYPLMDADPDREDQNAQYILRTVTIIVSATPNPINYKCQIKKKLKYENVIQMKNKPDLPL
jgi:hypothetical protein